MQCLLSIAFHTQYPKLLPIFLSLYYSIFLFSFPILGINDYTVTGAVIGFGQVALNLGQLFVEVSVEHTIDGVAQKKKNSTILHYPVLFNLQDYTFVGITGTIIDTDSKLT